MATPTTRAGRSAEEIRAALVASGGNVSSAAGVLGIARTNLYKRLAALGVIPDEYRAAESPRMAPRPPRPARAGRPVRVARTVYLRADQVQAIEAASLDLPAVLRERLSPSDVLGRFIDDAFGEWLTRTLARASGGM